jgi:hypothetical protein
MTMTTGKKLAVGAVMLGLVAIAGEVLWLHHERNSNWAPPVASQVAMDPDDLVFLKKQRPSDMADLKPLFGKTIWMSAAGQMEYYPYAAGRADYSKPVGTLLGAEPLAIKSAFEQVKPKDAQVRIAAGDKQALLAFTMPKSADPGKMYAVPVGYRQGKDYTFSNDDIFFYDDPHQLYSHWSPAIWHAIDTHQVILGMNERQVQLSLGQVFRSVSEVYGDRLVIYSNLGKPMAVTFEKNKVTAFRADQGF